MILNCLIKTIILNTTGKVLGERLIDGIFVVYDFTSQLIFVNGYAEEAVILFAKLTHTIWNLFWLFNIICISSHLFVPVLDMWAALILTTSRIALMNFTSFSKVYNVIYFRHLVIYHIWQFGIYAYTCFHLIILHLKLI